MVNLLLADSRRFVHAGLTCGKGADCVKCVSVTLTSISTNHALQERLLTATFGFAMCLGDVTWMLTRDASLIE